MAESKGPLVSKNNLDGQVQVAELTLVNTTALTWTHNFGATPLMVSAFGNGTTNTGVALAATQPVITTNANAIIVTPTGSINARLVIWWGSLPSVLEAGMPAAVFV